MADRDALERKLYVIRRVVEREHIEGLSIASFSSRTVVYKGMLTAPQLSRYFPDLADPRFESRLAVVHSRFSTNTFPSWELAHPYRMLAHNGEINTLRGNRNWMRARERDLASQLFGDDVEKIRPLLRDDISDSASLDGLLELLVLGGRSHGARDLDADARGLPGPARAAPGGASDFFAYHSALVEPWDGPAAVAFSDGRVVGRDPRPQRPAARALARDPRRLGGARLRDGRVQGGGRPGQGQGPAAPGQALPGRPRGRPGRAGRGDQAASWRGAAPTASGCATAWCTSRTCPSAARACRGWSRCARASSPSAGPRRTCA